MPCASTPGALAAKGGHTTAPGERGPRTGPTPPPGQPPPTSRTDMRFTITTDSAGPPAAADPAAGRQLPPPAVQGAGGGCAPGLRTLTATVTLSHHLYV